MDRLTRGQRIVQLAVQGLKNSDNDGIMATPGSSATLSLSSSILHESFINKILNDNTFENNNTGISATPGSNAAPSLSSSILHESFINEILNDNTSENEDQVYADYDPDWLKIHEVDDTAENNEDIDPSCTDIDGTVPKPTATTPQPLRKKSNPEQWKRNSERANRLKGESYKTAKGKEVAPRPIIIPRCLSKKNHDCASQFSEEERENIYTGFRNLPSVYEQRQFIIRHVTEQETKRKTTEGDSRRALTKTYNFSKGIEKVTVCREFFLDTLNISEGLVRGALSKLNAQGILLPEMRGKNAPANKCSAEDENFIKKHILSFPSVESHYCRKNTEYKYLDPSLNISKMYEEYKIRCEELQKRRVGFEKYRKIFREYKLTFHVPRKDQCKTCHKFQEKDKIHKLTENDLESYKYHLERKEAARNLKNVSKMQAKCDKTILAFNFDLQAVLSTPKGAQGPFFYVRKLAVYNLTVYNLGDASVECFLWDETEGRRGSVEISTSIYAYLMKYPDVETVIMMSDGCGGQQKNANFVSMCLEAIKRHPKIEQIDHIYFESGHSLMECDSIHQKIFTTAKKLPVYTPNGWVQQIRNARKKPAPYNVSSLVHGDFIDFNPNKHNFVAVGSKALLPFRKAVWFRYIRDNPVVLIKTAYEDANFQKFVVKLRKGRPSNSVPVKPYTKRFCISDAKRKDLKKLCDELQIPKAHHEFYEKLPCSENVRDALAEPHVSDDSEEDYLD